MEKKLLSEEEFYELVELEENHISANASFDGKMFETFGQEVEYVKSKIKENKVITILASDGDLYYSSGYWFVNRIGYLISKKPLKFEFEVKLEN